MKCRLLVVGFLLAAAFAPAQDFDAKVRELVRQYGNGTDDDLRLRLIDLGDQDQAVRRYDMDRLTNAQQRMVMEQMKATDRQLTAQLKEIVAEKGWPTVRMVGVHACEDAARVLVHSPDREFQRKLVPVVEKLADKGEIVGATMAPLIDQFLLADGKPQRFGTQYAVKDGKAVFEPVEDPAKLDERRAAWVLPPISEYKRQIAALYRLQVE